jgi:hypothetical protein
MLSFYINKDNIGVITMKKIPILIGLILLISCFMPLAMAAQGDIIPANKSVDSSSEKRDTVEKKTSSSDVDVWGIQQSDMKASDLVNIDKLTGIALGIVPLRNLSLISIAIAFILAFTSLIVGILLCAALAGYGAILPNVNESLRIITGSRSKILALGSVFFLSLFMIIMTFFFLVIFSKLDWFVA